MAHPWAVRPLRGEDGEDAAAALALVCAALPHDGVVHVAREKLFGANGAREGRTIATRNILTDPKLWLAPLRRADIEREGFKATVAAPLAAKDRILGALVVHYWTERSFGSEASVVHVSVFGS